MSRHIFIVVSILLCLAFGFQNCSEDVRFNSTELSSILQDLSNEDVICDPLAVQANCDLSSKNGLLGRLYYLTSEQAPLLANSSLYSSVLSDYINYGTQVDSVVLMNNIDISPRSWESGFQAGSGEFVYDTNGNQLLEWFSLDMYGYINLPAGDYEFSMVSDDGMRVEINNEIILNDDGAHAPRRQCGNQVVSFVDGQKQSLHVQYFQGPRVQIAMQLFYRPASTTADCSDSSSWEVVPASAFSHQ